MTLLRSRFSWLFALLLTCLPMTAEKVADLPMPTRYVNDFAGVLTPDGIYKIELLCVSLHNQANADIEVVTIKSLDDQSIEEFTSELEEKWKIGKKGSDRGVMIVMSMSPRKFRIETGYGLEGILPDAKVGRIRDQATPFASAGNYDEAMMTAVQGLADVIAADAHVSLTPIAPSYPQGPYHRQRSPSPASQRAVLIGVVILLLILWRTGHIGWLFYLLLNITMGGDGWGSGRGGGFGGDGGGGGFGGSGGGESGGGGASGDF